MGGLMERWTERGKKGRFLCQGDFQLQIVESLSRVMTGRDGERFHLSKKKEGIVIGFKLLPETLGSGVSN